MEQCLIENLYDMTGTIAAELFEGLKYPWEALPLIGDFIKKLGPTLDPAVYEQKGENIWIAKSATIAPSASTVSTASAKVKITLLTPGPHSYPDT